ncbi:type I pantothenate kinase [Aerococcus sp. 1KP-2016]|uniref:type I pantothenate kinase n=1 Tax=Aerococcus sp. 1KP-2016 TaxID=1981982 RepID=UPI000B990652|nr:type I pantothenate kinase [Aerococcus sp. 1KP-2016]OYQ67901.1 type I pantothenate kinase [Aerococcus sp. 1KP-2016]
MQVNRDYYIIDRKEWNHYLQDLNNPFDINLTNEQLNSLTSLNDSLTIRDAIEVYKPLTQLISIYRENYNQLETKRAKFMGISEKIPPFIIGIAGGVAVGKSTTARLLKLFLAHAYPKLNVELVTTDGFLYPNKILQEKGIMNRKGFPESYNMEKLEQFLVDVKSNKEEIVYPKYSHSIYDIIEDGSNVLRNPQILIVEGINVLQTAENSNVFMSDFWDLSVYVDADSDMIEKWFYQRFRLLVLQAKDRPEDYYYQFRQLSFEKAMQMAGDTWRNINLVNLQEYILPTRNRANIVIHKEDHHYINELWIKKY